MGHSGVKRGPARVVTDRTLVTASAALRDEVGRLRRQVRILQAVVQLLVSILRIAGFRLDAQRRNARRRRPSCRPSRAPSSFSRSWRSCECFACRRLATTPGGVRPAPRPHEKVRARRHGQLLRELDSGYSFEHLVDDEAGSRARGVGVGAYRMRRRREGRRRRRGTRELCGRGGYGGHGRRRRYAQSRRRTRGIRRSGGDELGRHGGHG